MKFKIGINKPIGKTEVFYTEKTYTLNEAQERVLFYATCGIFLIIAFIAISMVYANTNEVFKIKKNTDSETIANQINFVKETNNKGSISYKPIFYYTVNNKQYTCYSSHGSNAEISLDTVHYNSGNPKICVSQHDIYFSYMDIFITVLIVAAIFCTIISNFLKRQKNKEEEKGLGT